MSKGLNRDTSDKFYTKETISKLCIKEFIKAVNPKKTDTIVEPSAGNGSFSKHLMKIFKNVYSYDLYPEADYIQQQDFLSLIVNFKNVIHVIGNPPFGRQSTLAKKFIKKSCSFANTVSFILPKSFKKESFQKTFPLNFHNILSIDLPTYSFIIDDKEYDVPCIFQIWEKRDVERVETKNIDMKEFYKYVKADENPDVSVRRVGVYAGKIDTDCSKSVQSHYFLKLCENINIQDFVKKVSEIEFERDNTVGPRSISKKELNKEIFLKMKQNIVKK